MDNITVKAKTLAEAITKAAIELGTSSDNLEYTIQEQTSGFLGFGKTVTINAKKKADNDLDDLFAAVVEGREEVKEPAKETAKESKKDAAKAPVKEKEQVKEVKEPQKEAQKEQKKEVKKEVKKEKKDNHKEFKTEFKTESKYEVKSMKGKEMSKNSNPEKSTDKEIQKEVVKETLKKNVRKDSHRDNRSYRESIEEERENQRLAEEKRTQKEKERKENRKPVNVEACKNAAENFLTQVFAAMNMNVSIETVYDEEEVEMTVNLAGEDMGILIGKRGQTLDSLQYLVSLVVNKETEGYLRVKLDTENYRARRKETLEILAKNIAYKVRRTRKSVSLEPMNPYERRIIHATLQSDNFVSTRSEGEDPYRHVVVFLKRESREHRRGGYSKHNNQNHTADAE